jgi:hypothetical protein
LSDDLTNNKLTDLQILSALTKVVELSQSIINTQLTMTEVMARNVSLPKEDLLKMTASIRTSSEILIKVIGDIRTGAGDHRDDSRQ